MEAHRMDQETVERLLGGPVVDPQDDTRSLALLLTAVRAAPRPRELAGEDAAMRAYQLARAGTPLPLPGRPPRRLPLTRIGVRAALAGLALAATGGVALAAAGGALPNPLYDPAPSTAPPSTAPITGGSPTAASDGGSRSPTGVNGRPEPSASMVGLCRAYRADAGTNPGRALDNPAFAELVDAAGGRDKVGGYCDRVLSEDAERPTPTARPGGVPTTRPSGRNTAPPSAPGGPPTASDQDSPGNEGHTSPPGGGSA